MRKRPDPTREVQGRNVVRVAIAYALCAWLVVQLAQWVLNHLEAPDSALTALLILLALGFPVAVFKFRSFDFSASSGDSPTPVNRFRAPPDPVGKLLDRFIIAFLAVNLVLLTVEKGSENGVGAASGDSSTTLSAAGEKGAGQSAAPSLNVPPKSVAVLPFALLSNGPDDFWFADGFSEGIIDRLSQLPELMITARTSAFHFRTPDQPAGEMARKLGVANVLDGTVSRAGSQLRITAQLIRATDGFRLWSDSWDGHTDDTFAVQQEIAEKVAAALSAAPGEHERTQMERVGLNNLEALIAFQKGQELFEKAHLAQVDFSFLRQANLQYEAVMSLAPDYTPAYIRHADLFTHILTSLASGQLDGTIAPSDAEYAPSELRFDYEEAVRTAEDAGERQIAAGDRALLMGEWRGLADLSRRALTASRCQAALWSSLVAAPFGDARVVRDAFSRMIACDPLDGRARVHGAQAYLWLEQPVLAQQAAALALQDPERSLRSEHFFFLVWTEALALGMLGDFEAARQAINSRELTEEGRSFLLSLVASMEGEYEQAGDYLHDFLSQHGPDDQASLVLEAARGNRNEANHLAAQIDGRPFGYLALLQGIYLCGCGALFELEATPVFAGMLAESGLSWPPGKPLRFPLKDG